MFRDCQQLIASPDIKATSLTTNAMQHMFAQCYNIESITVRFTSWGSDSGTYEWLLDANEDGTFYKYNSLTVIRDESHIPDYWEISIL